MRLARLALLALVPALLVAGLPAPAAGQTDDPVGGPRADVDCPQFISSENARAVFVAARTLDEPDPYGLDDTNQFETDPDFRPCEGTDFDPDQRATCANFKEQAHAQALLEAASGDPYGLDADDDGEACRPDADEPPAEDPPANEPPAPTPDHPAPEPEASGCVTSAKTAHAFAGCGEARVSWPEPPAAESGGVPIGAYTAALVAATQGASSQAAADEDRTESSEAADDGPALAAEKRGRQQADAGKDGKHKKRGKGKRANRR